ncbi:hypothetical protein [Paenibacillus sp. 7523-1]|uniref:hypothetical protein n=1 Tax=Paenibacillus sp. 7523-1 TaxID=2022550 RepID=UPI000BA7168E|nr:hypothetical protein [Paenibacillus sp. 7523-1]PAD31753.1 hypothetical protein CHH60_10560 [Paenibacillus sp. 7523-1]
MTITTYLLPALYEQKKISTNDMEEIVRLLAQAPLLYDDGSSIRVEDFTEGLDMDVKHEVRPALMELYDLAVKACRQFPDPSAYEQLQDALGLQAELWQEEVLDLVSWMTWLKQVGEGQRALPEYDFASMLGTLPEGFMIHDFYDELRYQLEQNPSNTWAIQERDRLFAAMGAR